jgi:hypothetical protein
MVVFETSIHLAHILSHLVTSLCIATNQHAEFLIRSGNFKSYARSDGTWERVAEAEMER